MKFYITYHCQQVTYPLPINNYTLTYNYDNILLLYFDIFYKFYNFIEHLQTGGCGKI